MKFLLSVCRAKIKYRAFSNLEILMAQECNASSCMAIGGIRTDPRNGNSYIDIVRFLKHAAWIVY